MKTTEANIGIVRHGKVLSVSVIMPTWNKIESDNSISINIPLLGLTTFATDNDDISPAIQEAIKAFCIAAERFGKGLERELEEIGWECVETQNDSSILDFNVPDDNSVLEQLMKTGDQYAHRNLAIA